MQYRIHWNERRSLTTFPAPRSSRVSSEPRVQWPIASRVNALQLIYTMRWRSSNPRKVAWNPNPEINSPADVSSKAAVADNVCAGSMKIRHQTRCTSSRRQRVGALWHTSTLNAQKQSKIVDEVALRFRQDRGHKVYSNKLGLEGQRTTTATKKFHDGWQF